MRENNTKRNSAFGIRDSGKQRVAIVREPSLTVGASWSVSLSRYSGLTVFRSLVFPESRIPNAESRCCFGFSLIEVLLAIGVMGVGMVMAAALFPAAVKENVNSTTNALSAIICENGLAIAKVKLSQSDVTGSSLSDESTHIGDIDRKYAGSDRMGFSVLGKQFTGNDYLLAILAYNKMQNDHKVTVESLTGTIADTGDVSRFTIAAATDYFKPGSILLKDDGSIFAIIKVVSSQTEVILDRRITAGSGAYLVMIERNNDNTITTNVDSPYMGMLTTRTALR